MSSSAFPFASLLLAPIERHLDRMAARIAQPADMPRFDFSEPKGEPALVGPDSVSWRIFKNPVALFTGGVAAVILELAEPKVRTGVWEHSSFRTDPVTRLQRTGLAAMLTVYGPRRAAERMIAGVVRRHAAVTGATPGGEAYEANDPRLLTWVQATATFGFAMAYDRFVTPLDEDELSQAFAEGIEAARLYGAVDAPVSLADWRDQLEGMRDRLEPSLIVVEFLDIMRRAPALPLPLRPLQRLMVRGAVELVPDWVRDRLGLNAEHGLGPVEALVLRQAGALADRIVLRSGAAAQASVRLGLPADHLYRR
jgi:uncharacterized protein (DUF2236 family)